MELLPQDDFQLKYNEESINAIENLISKIEKQVDQKTDRLLKFQLQENAFQTYDQFNQIIHQSNNIYNLCIQQLQGELQLLNLTPLANQYQRIFNALNKQLRSVLKFQKNLLEQAQIQDKKKLKAEKLVMLKSENIPQIPQINRNKIETKILQDQPLEMQIATLLEQTQKEQLEKDKVIYETQMKIYQYDQDLKDAHYKTQNHIVEIEDSLEKKKWSMSRNYSGAIDVYNNINQDQKRQQQMSQDMMNGLKSYDNIDSSDDENMTAEQREKKKRAKQLLKFQNNLMEQKIQKSNDLNNLVNEMTIYYEKQLKDQQFVFNQMVENFQAVKRIAYYLIDVIQKCKCNIIDKKILQKLYQELTDIDGKAKGEIEMQQKQQEQHQQSLQSMMNKQQMIQGGSSPVPGQTVVGSDGQVYKVDSNGNVVVQPAGSSQDNSKNLQKQSSKQLNKSMKNSQVLEEGEELKKTQSSIRQQKNGSQHQQENQGFTQNIQPLVMEPTLPKGVKPLLDANGNQKLDKNGNPIFVDKSGKPVKLNEKQMNDYQESVKKIEKQKEKMNLPAGSKIVTQAVTKTVESKFIMKNGKKVEVFQNENGEFYTKDESGKPTILSEKEVSNIKTETKKVTVMETFIVDKTGKKQQVQLNEDGDPVIIDKSGRVINLNQPLEQQYENYQEVKVDKNGNQYIVDKKTGKQLIVQTNEDGQQFVVNEKGEQVLINQPKAQKPQVKTDKNGNKYIINEKGQKVEVFVNQFGEQCIKDANGFIVPVDQIGSDKAKEEVQMTQQVYENEKGEKFVLGSNGERLLIKQDENGNTYFENSKGEKQLISKKALQQLEKKTPIIMNEKGEMFIKDKDGKIKEVVVNQFGEQFVKDENGQLVQINKDPSGTVKIPVQTDKNGKQFIVDKTGKKLMVNVDKHGNQFVIGDDGKKVMINKNPNNPLNNAKKTKVLKDTEVFEDDKGNKFVYDKFGQKQKVELGKNGKPFFRDANGNVVMVKADDQNKIERDENGNEFVLVNGQKQTILVNEDGEKYFINENGDVQIIQEPQSEYESEDEPIPDYVDPDGKCKYCGQKYVPSQIKHKGDCYIDEKGNKYVLDSKGNKIYVKVDDNGNEYYIGANGVKFVISKFKSLVSKLMLLNKLNNVKVQEFNLSDKFSKQFKIEDKELMNKVLSLDDETQNKLLKQFQCNEFQTIKIKLLPQKIDQGDILEVYELTRKIGANYKMSDSEFVAKIIQFKTLHFKCLDNCQHLDLYLKRLFVQNQMTKALKNMKKIQFQKKRFKKVFQQDNIADKTLDLTDKPLDITIDKTLSTTIDNSIQYQ